MIESLSLSILKEKSKDIRIILFLSLVYLYKEDWERFCDTFEGLTLLVDSSYESIFPDRGTAKEMAFRWLSEGRFADVIKDKKPDKKAYQHITKLSSTLDNLKILLLKRYPESNPFPQNLYTIVENWKNDISDNSKSDNNSDTILIPNTAAKNTTQTDIQKKGNDTFDPLTAQKTSRQLANFLINKHPFKISGYRLIRNIRWDQIEYISASPDNKTQLEGPSTQLKNRFQYLLSQKSWENLIKEAESAFVSGHNHLWLDLQRLEVSACKALDKNYENVASVILQDTLFLIKRIPDLLKLDFFDGTPFCDETTKVWLNTANSCTDLSKHSHNGSQSPITSDSIKKLAENGNIEQALSLFQNSIRLSANEHDRFTNILDFGLYLLSINNPEMAFFVLETLDQKISEYNLVYWDPEIAASGWLALLKACKASGNHNRRCDEIMNKLCNVNPLQAYLLFKQDGKG